VFDDNARTINEPFLPEQIGYIENPKQATNIEQAKALLDQAGWKVASGATVRSKNNTNFEITLATSDFALNANTAENLAKQWQALQINVKVNVFSNKELTDNIIRPRLFDALVLPQKLDADPDPFVFWHSSQSKNPGVNVTGFSNAEADKLMSEARATTDTTLRAQKYQRISQLISENVPAIFLNQSVYIYALDKKIQGINLTTLLDASYRVYDIPNWYISTSRSWK
jgi:peptide/nickel transport system substrate-binding protein